MIKRFLVTAIVFVSVISLAACAPATEEEPASGLANPASVYCEEQGGTLEIRESAAGQYGVCMFEDGSECEEWAFFRDECKPGDMQEAPAPDA